FAQSVAVMAVVGHALGLGDRHLDNILCDVAAGTIVHIDFNMAFGRGALLRVPEIVPFRMSPMFLAAMGYNVGLQGPFAAAAARTAAMLRSRTAATLVTRLIESLVLDAEWDAAGGAGGSVNDEDDHRRAAALAILTTVRRKLAGAVAPDGSSEVLSVEDQIQRLIDMATDETRAASMYEGWTPWI
ncbi:kinase-like domain-containing protein, partial [Blastocladiella britannica]